MTDRKIFSTDQLVQMCREFMTPRPTTEPDPDHEGWDSRVVLTPRMVADIIAANNET